MSQGYEATHSGAFLERAVEGEFQKRGFLFKDYDADGDNLDLLCQRIVIRRSPYISLYGCHSHSEFLIADRSRMIRVECRWQEVAGSVDEKFPYMLANAIGCPEQEVLLLIDGGGARTAAVDWLKKGAKDCTTKKIYVLTVREFPRWVREQFVHAAVA